MPVCLLSSYSRALRVCYLEQAIYCIAYLKKYNRSKMVFDDTYLSFGYSIFVKHNNWSACYPEAAELYQLMLRWPEVIHSQRHVLWMLAMEDVR